jgi:hypothetical protein
MGSRDEWKKSAYKRQKMRSLQTSTRCEVTAEPVCKVTAKQVHEVNDAAPSPPENPNAVHNLELTQAQNAQAIIDVLAEPVLAESTQPALAAEQAREVNDAESAQPVLAKPALSQFSPPTPVPPVSPFPSVSPHKSASPALSISRFPLSPVHSVSPFGRLLYYPTATPTAL